MRNRPLIKTPSMMRLPMAFVLPLVLVLASCTTSSDPTATDPTSTGPTTPTAPSTATATATFTGESCAYDGPSEFDADSTVTFTVINETDTETAFGVWKIPEGTTPEEIYDEGIDNAVPSSADDDAGYSIDVVLAPITGEAYDLTVTFLESGQHGINCFPFTGQDTENDYVTMFAVTG